MPLNSINRIGFVGGGNMAEAFVKGLLSSGFNRQGICFFEPNTARREELVRLYGIEAAPNNKELVSSSDIVVLATKPQIVDKVLADIRPAVKQDTLLISILAGVTTETLEGALDEGARIIRAMPNTPALVGQGAAALCSGSHADETDSARAQHLFELIGTVQWVEEGQMDAVTGLSGSGPAYVYTVIEALADGGVQEGLRRDIALALAIQTVLGAATLVKETGEHPALLRDKVCSPAGTTITAIRVLEERGLRATLMEAVSAATRRSKELGGPVK